MAKRKRGELGGGGGGDSFDRGTAAKRTAPSATPLARRAPPSPPPPPPPPPPATSIQIVAGSYERVLHGIVATVPDVRLRAAAADLAASPAAAFADSFLFNAHTSSIRCLAVSPPSADSQRVLLATGGTDERINLYALSLAPPPPPQSTAANGPASRKDAKQPQSAPLLLQAVANASNPANKPLGTLTHHASTVTALAFPTRTKLLSADSHNNIAVLRTRDWAVLSTLRAPLPPARNRPSGDTAATPADLPAGVNALAVHPSLRLMLTVGRGERCMRLWNLVTGRKAGVLSFGRDMLRQLGEGRFSSGEASKVVWDPDAGGVGRGELFAVAFERGALLFGLDCKPRRRLVPHPPSKLHQLRFLSRQTGLGEGGVLAVSTEDGRVLFYAAAAAAAAGDGACNGEVAAEEPSPSDEIPSCRLLGQLGGRSCGVQSRIKDFQILSLGGNISPAGRAVVVTACSDGAVHLWVLDAAELHEQHGQAEQAEHGANGDAKVARQVGTLIGTYETANRITCMEAFVMDGEPEELAGLEAEDVDAAGVSSGSSASSSDDDGDE